MKSYLFLRCQQFHTFNRFLPGIVVQWSFLFLSLLFLCGNVSGQSQIPFKCSPLTMKGDLSAIMVEHVDSFLTRMTMHSQQVRDKGWKWNFSSPTAFNQSIDTQRGLLEKRLGVADTRLAPRMQVLNDKKLHQYQLETKDCVIRAVSWDVLAGMPARGLLLQPKGKIKAEIVLIPDADLIPEVLAGIRNPDAPCFGIARQLAKAGCEVLIPTLVNRQDSYSGSKYFNDFTNETHREWIYRQGFEVGRTVIGYELQKIFAAIDWFKSQHKSNGSKLPIGVAGYGEGGLLALYAAALDTRISSTLVSGYFDRREGLWEEPIYRNVFGLLNNFGDAEVAVMSWPRTLVVEQSKAPEIQGPPLSSHRSMVAAPGQLTTPSYASAKEEWERAKFMLHTHHVNIHWCADNGATFQKPFSITALKAFTNGLKLTITNKFLTYLPHLQVSVWIDTTEREKRTVQEMQRTVQQVVQLCERTRQKKFWDKLSGDTLRQDSVREVLRAAFWKQIGRLPDPSVPANVRARLMQKTNKWTSYQVMLDVWKGVFTYGILLIPNDLEPGEKRPLVVCQHGLEGDPMDVVTTNPKAANYHFYRGFASQLADKGYIVFAPANIYKGEDKFRVLQRKANPLGLSLFSIIVGQHQRIVQWLQQLPFVESNRIGFYGLSYGGCSAMRIPALIKGYSFSICSANFNEWVRKVASVNYVGGYVYNEDYEMSEWDLGHTFNYAEMAALIAPRPFMVERGYFDGVGTDKWISYEFAKVQLYYTLLGFPDRVRIEHFLGKHTIHGVGTFEFIDHFFKNNPQY